MQARRLGYAFLIPFLIGAAYLIPQQTVVHWDLDSPIVVLGDSPSGMLLNRPVDFVAGNGDTLYVLDEGDKRVAAFSLSGEFLFAFGRNGQGPGEFQRPTSIEFNAGMLCVLDRQLNRLVTFDSAGGFRSSRQLEHPARDFTLAGDSAFLATTVSTALLTEIRLDRSQSEPAQARLQRPDDMEAAQDVRGFAYQAAGSYVARTNGLIVYLSGANGRIASLSVSDPSRTPQWAQLNSTLIDDYFDGFRRREARLNREGRFLIPSWCSHVGSWLDSGILVQILVGMQTPEAKLVAAVFDPVTGEERGVRITAAYRYLRNLRLLGGDLIGGINNAESTVQVFRLPAGWREWGAKDRARRSLTRA